jgi:hypothetical protein
MDFEERITKQGDVSVGEALCEVAASLSAAGHDVVRTARLGPSGCQAIEHVVRDRRSRAQARRYSASHVDRRK